MYLYPQHILTVKMIPEKNGKRKKQYSNYRKLDNFSKMLFLMTKEVSLRLTCFEPVSNYKSVGVLCKISFVISKKGFEGFQGY